MENTFHVQMYIQEVLIFLLQKCPLWPFTERPLLSLAGHLNLETLLPSSGGAAALLVLVLVLDNSDAAVQLSPQF